MQAGARIWLQISLVCQRLFLANHNTTCFPMTQRHRVRGGGENTKHCRQTCLVAAPQIHHFPGVCLYVEHGRIWWTENGMTQYSTTSALAASWRSHHSLAKLWTNLRNPINTAVEGSRFCVHVDLGRCQFTKHNNPSPLLSPMVNRPRMQRLRRIPDILRPTSRSQHRGLLVLGTYSCPTSHQTRRSYNGASHEQTLAYPFHLLHLLPLLPLLLCCICLPSSVDSF